MDERSIGLRRAILGAFAAGGRGHLGSALSIVEILRVLYDDILRFDPRKPLWEARDRFILSKGHGCLALYCLLAEKGFFPTAELGRFCKRDGLLGGHPERGTPGVEVSTGSLGHGLSIGVGFALAARMDAPPRRVARADRRAGQCSDEGAGGMKIPFGRREDLIGANAAVRFELRPVI